MVVSGPHFTTPTPRGSGGLGHLRTTDVWSGESSVSSPPSTTETRGRGSHFLTFA